ncbi:hypothetical protein BGZ65_009399, partial [Modicella reniformis]
MNGQAIVINTVEVYGRLKTLDAHREQSVVRKGIPVASSLPPPFRTPYKNVWPLTIHSQEGDRLVIGTLSFNALVTSSLRLDTKMDASVGEHTLPFLLSDPAHSLRTRIFLDYDSVETGLRLAASPDATCVSNSDKVCQLRQTKTKFHDLSTYYLCRASSQFAQGHVYQPCTLYTLSSSDLIQSGAGLAASNIFRTIALNVLKSGERAVLERATVEKFRRQCTNDVSIANEMDTILSLYRNGMKSITIIDNHELNKPLEQMAMNLSTYITSVNT